jgi:predicted homoserine dehydrogenase-like protein
LPSEEDVPQDQVLACADVELPDGRLRDEARAEQDDYLALPK